jgi:hypothetical protein
MPRHLPPSGFEYPPGGFRPSRAFQARELGGRALPRDNPTSLTLTCTPSAPLAGSGYLVPRIPFAVSDRPGVVHGKALQRASARLCTELVVGSSLRCTVPRSSPLARRPREQLSWGFVPYDICQHGGSGSPGGSTPRHLPPSGFDYPPGGLRPSAPGDGPSTAATSMGFSLQGLAPPGQRYPSRGLASPVVSSASRAREAAATPEVVSGGEGARLASAEAKTAEPCPRGFWPLQGFLLHHL